MKTERLAILGGGIAGLLGVYQAAGKSLKTYYSGSEVALVDASFSALWYVGLTILAASALLAIYSIIVRRNEISGVNTALLIMSTIFFAPYFFIGDALLAFASFTWAHGLQYNLFLLVHAMSRQDTLKPTKKISARLPIILCTIMFFAFCGYFVKNLIVWATQFGTLTAALMNIQANYPMILNMVVAFLTGITMVHFVWDSKIWRLRDPEPRQWVRERYGFLFK